MNMKYVVKNCLIKILVKSGHPSLKNVFAMLKKLCSVSFFNLYCSYLLVRLVQLFIKSGHPSLKNVFPMRKNFVAFLEIRYGNFLISTMVITHAHK